MPVQRPYMLRFPRGMRACPACMAQLKLEPARARLVVGSMVNCKPAPDDAARVLVVEDEPLVRDYVAEVLAESGFKVLEAANGQEALALLSDNPSVCAVVSDVAMPGSVNGFELARRLRKELPDLGIVLVSGVLEEDHIYLPLGVRFVSKPVRAATLIRLVREVADPRANLPAGAPPS
jgi:CheY-like chemotaxis protein